MRELEQQLEEAKLAKYESDSEDEESESDLLAAEEDALDEEGVEAKHKAEMKEAQKKIDQLDAEVGLLAIPRVTSMLMGLFVFCSWYRRVSASRRWRSSWRPPRGITLERLLVCARNCSSWKSVHRWLA